MEPGPVSVSDTLLDEPVLVNGVKVSPSDCVPPNHIYIELSEDEWRLACQRRL